MYDHTYSWGSGIVRIDSNAFWYPDDGNGNPDKSQTAIETGTIYMGWNPSWLSKIVFYNSNDWSTATIQTDVMGHGGNTSIDITVDYANGTITYNGNPTMTQQGIQYILDHIEVDFTMDVSDSRNLVDPYYSPVPDIKYNIWDQLDHPDYDTIIQGLDDRITALENIRNADEMSF